MKKFFSFIAAVLFAGSMMAESVTLTVEDYAATEFKANGISVTTAKNTGSTAPAYNGTGKDLRIYAKGSITIASEQTIQGISFVISDQGKKRLAPLTANVGEVAVVGDPDFTAVWTGEANEVTLTVGEKADYGTEGNSKAGQLCFTAIEVTLGATEPVEEFYLTGSMTGWSTLKADVADYKFIPGNAGEYKLDVEFEEAIECKAIGLKEGEATKWYPTGMENNLKLEAGAYTILLRPAGDGDESWHYGVLKAQAKDPGSEIALDFADGQVTTSDFEEYGAVDVTLFDFASYDETTGAPIGDGKYINLDFYPEDANDINGTFSIAEESLDAEYTYLIVIEGTDTTKITFTEGWATFAVSDIDKEESTATVKVTAALTGEDGNLYTIDLTKSMYYEFVEDTPVVPEDLATEGVHTLTPVKEEATGTAGTYSTVIDGIQLDWEGAYYETDFRAYANKTMTITAGANIVKIEIAGLAKKDQELSVDHGTFTVGGEKFASETTKATLDDPLVVIENSNAKSVTISCTKQLQARIIRVTLEGTTGIEETLSEGKAVKVLRDGQIIIMKGDKSFNTIGQIVR